ncbi:hypothetical protein BH23PAT2_BH23PAT2_09070 [soil metagenome]
MTTQQAVNAQLRQIQADFRFWGRSEVRELPNLLFPDETIVHAMNGRYEKGFVLFVATDKRLLLIDKKPFFLCFEDMQYEMISEVDYTQQMLSSDLCLRTPGRTLHFVSLRPRQLRALTNYIQQRVSDMRHPALDQKKIEQPESVYQHYFDQPYPIPPEESRTAEPQQQPQSQPLQYMKQYPKNPYHSATLRIRQRVPKFTPPPEPNQM